MKDIMECDRKRKLFTETSLTSTHVSTAQKIDRAGKLTLLFVFNGNVGSSVLLLVHIFLNDMLKNSSYT